MADKVNVALVRLRESKRLSEEFTKRLRKHEREGGLSMSESMANMVGAMAWQFLEEAFDVGVEATITKLEQDSKP